jgi:tetratricopeptide (TPR) repeat protein
MKCFAAAFASLVLIAPILTLRSAVGSADDAGAPAVSTAPRTNPSPDELIQQYTRIIQENPKNAYAYTQRGTQYGLKGDTDKALADFDHAIRLDAKSWIAFYSRGVVYSKMKPTPSHVRHAIDDFLKSIEISPNSADSHSALGAEYEVAGELEKAIRELDLAISLSPRFPDAYLNRGNAYCKKGERAKGIADYDQAIRLNPRFELAYRSRGGELAISGELSRAYRDMNEAIKLSPTDPEAYFNRAYVQAMKGNPDEAISDYSQTIRLDPTRGDAYYARSAIYQSKGDSRHADEDLAKSKELGYKP